MSVLNNTNYAYIHDAAKTTAVALDHDFYELDIAAFLERSCVALERDEAGLETFLVVENCGEREAHLLRFGRAIIGAKGQDLEDMLANWDATLADPQAEDYLSARERALAHHVVSHMVEAARKMRGL
ncbi:hypothetical protein [uncultured Thiodictyon sp.]|uniref:hypothetical protein n=1 Tax=uncultured Thiodictyon sp. TaxID=1846217 RepID=UPI0025D798E7|nr:hypothetical protein [uncultured Thiodictyon sp.]